MTWWQSAQGLSDTPEASALRSLLIGLSISRRGRGGPGDAGNVSGPGRSEGIDMEQTATFDVDRISALIVALKTALDCTPQHMALEERLRLALSRLPDRVVREIGDNARALAMLAEVRLSD